MSKPAQKQLEQQVETGVTTDEIEGVAQAMLKALDDHGKAGVEEQDPLGGGPIRVHRDEDGRVFIRTPREIRISTRLELRKGRLCWGENKGTLVAFLNRNRLAVSFLKRVFKPKR
jgi:hypothetical protein